MHYHFSNLALVPVKFECTYCKLIQTKKKKGSANKCDAMGTDTSSGEDGISRNVRAPFAFTVAGPEQETSEEFLSDLRVNKTKIDCIAS